VLHLLRGLLAQPTYGRSPCDGAILYEILCRNDAVNPDLLLLPVIAISTSALSYMAVVPQGPSAAAGGTGSHAAGCRPA
jgi:hypothetical protein